MSGGRSAQNKIIEHQNKQQANQYKYDLENYNFQYGRIPLKDEEGNFVLDENGEKVFEQQYDDDGSKSGVLNNQYEYQLESLNLRKQADQETRAYQEETANQNWEQGKSMQQYQWDQEDRLFKKNSEQYTNQLSFNELEYDDALAREKAVLNERFIEASFQNQGIIQDLYEATGTAGFNKAKTLLNLENRKNTIQYQKEKQLTNLKQSTKGAGFATAGKQLDILDGRGKGKFQTASQYLDLAAKESQNRFAKERLNLDTKAQTQALEFQNQMLRRESNKASLDTAKQIEDNAVQALKASGQAQLTQAGRSQGKAVQSVLAELGRQNNYLAESMIRGQDVAGARMKQNRLTALNTVQRAALAEQQINFSTIENINKAMLNVDEINRGLKISDAKGQISLDEIQQGVVNNIENASLDVRQLENELSAAQTDTGLSLKKMEFDLDMLGKRFETNQDILRAQLESAVRTSEMNMKDVYRAKTQADLNAEARRMLDPSVGRNLVDLENFRPIELPEAIYQDPMAPEIGPPPIEGAMQSPISMGQALPGAALGGLTAGLGTYAGLGAMSAFKSGGAMYGMAGPLGALVGLGTFAMGLF